MTGVSVYVLGLDDAHFTVLGHNAPREKLARRMIPGKSVQGKRDEIFEIFSNHKGFYVQYDKYAELDKQDHDEISYMYDCISMNDSLSYLSIRDHNSSFPESLRINQHLESLSFDRTRPTVRQFDMLFDSLPNINMLRELTFTESVNRNHLRVLSQCQNLCIESLSIEHVDFGKDGISHLVDLLEQQPIKHLSISTDKILLTCDDLTDLFNSDHVLESVVIGNPIHHDVLKIAVPIITKQNCSYLKRLELIAFEPSEQWLLSDIPDSLTELSINTQFDPFDIAELSRIFNSNIEKLHVECLVIRNHLLHDDRRAMDYVCLEHVNTSITDCYISAHFPVNIDVVVYLITTMSDLIRFTIKNIAVSPIDPISMITCRDDMIEYMKVSKLCKYTVLNPPQEVICEDKINQSTNANTTLIGLCLSKISQMK
jgi:hypothetical protein